MTVSQHKHRPHARTKTYQGADNNRLVASVSGDHPRTALLLHGGGQTRHAWDQTRLQLAEAGWTAIAPDQRGHGESAWVENRHYSNADFAADALAVADAITREKGQPPVLIGASLGGLAGMYALGQRKDAFAALILVDVTPHIEPSGLANIQGFMRAKAKEGFASIEDVADAVAAYLPHRPRPKSLEGLRKNLRHCEDGRWRWHWDPAFLDGPRPIGTGGQQNVAQLVAILAQLTLPIQLVRGRSSELVTEEAVEKFKALAPHAEYADIAGARHMVAGDRNDAFASAILDFMRRI